MKKHILTTISLIIFGNSYAQSMNSSDENFLKKYTDNYLSQYASTEYISTAALTAQCKQKDGSEFLDSAYSGTLGFGNDPTEQRETSKEDLFQIGSITKSFISVVLLQIEANPKYNFSINDPVEKWFPEYSNWFGMTDDKGVYHTLLVRQLLDMTSGIPNYTEEIDFLKTIFYTDPNHSYVSKSDIVNHMSSKNLDFAPGTKYYYSNTNYTLLGLLIERITHNSVKHEIEDRIINKLQLAHTFYPNNFAQEVYSKKELVHGYNRITEYESFLPDKADITDYSLSWANSAGAIISNTDDVNTYVHALFAPGKLLTSTQIEQLETSEPGIVVENDDNFYGTYGLGIGKFYDKKLNETFFQYQGGTTGFRFTYFYFPNRDLNAVFAVNSSYEKDNSSAFIYKDILSSLWQTKCF